MKGVSCIDLIHYSQWRFLVNTVINLKIRTMPSREKHPSYFEGFCPHGVYNSNGESGRSCETVFVTG
jgi:hypothetical protein